MFTLLCDREILCSHNHQDYLQNYKSYADVRKVLAGMTKRLKGEASDANYYAIIRQCAVSGVSNTELRDKFKQMLDFLHDVAAARSVQHLKELRSSDASITSSDFEILLRNQNVRKQPFWLICILAMPRFTEVLKDGLSCEQLEVMLSTLGYNSTRKSDIRLRIKGMRLLEEAITVLDVCSAQCKKSWELFISVFGNRVSSSEEATLWHKILDTNGRMRPNSFPLIRLQLLISGAINSCLPTQPERLYSYQSASPLHTRGGYAEFLKDHPSAVDEIAKRIKQNRAKWKAELSQYQRAWSTDTLIIADAAKLCYISSSKLAWGALCREYGIVNFCKQYVNKHIGQESIQAELKALLTEHAIRQVLNDDARDILKRAAKALFNTKFGFDVQFLQG